MATDFDACGFGAITPELILRSLIGCVDTLAVNDVPAIRVELYTADAVLSPVHCASMEDFMLNLQRCLEMAADGYVTLRVNMLSGTVAYCPDCADGKNWYDYAGSVFGEDAQGVVYVNFISTNAPN